MIEYELTISQARAKHAMDEINRIKNEEATGFKSHVNALPAKIVMNGLMQAIAYVFSKSKEDNGYKKLGNVIQNWLCDQKYGIFKSEKDLLNAIINSNENDYVRTHIETLAYLEWLKKFSSVYLKDVEDVE
ncbi:MAG: type III-B CRISPR module-associated protein Cmr5 [Thermoplasmataceae archaeon]